MANAVDICNVGLVRLGAQPIGSFEDDSDIAALCSVLYPNIRDKVLSSHPWNFATAAADLSRDADGQAAPEWSYVYILPADMVSGPAAVYGDGSSRPVSRYDIIGDRLHCDYETVSILYRNRPSESAMPPWFRDLLSLAFSEEAAMAVTGNASAADALSIKLNGSPGFDGMGGAYAAARRIDAQAAPSRSLTRNGDILTATRY